MPKRNATAIWNGTLENGRGKMSTESGALENDYSFGSRFQDTTGTNPEELIGAAHAGCFSMALAMGLGQAGFDPKEVKTSAEVTIEKQGEGFAIQQIMLSCKAEVPKIDPETFQEIANDAKVNCPVSQALSSVDIRLQTTLIS